MSAKRSSKIWVNSVLEIYWKSYLLICYTPWVGKVIDSSAPRWQMLWVCAHSTL